MLTAEQTTVGLSIKVPAAFDRAVDIGVVPENFKDERLGRIWKAMLELHSREIEVSIASVSSQIPGIDLLLLELTEVHFHGDISIFAKAVITGSWVRKSRESIAELDMAFSKHAALDSPDSLKELVEQKMLDMTGSVKSARGNLYDAIDCVIAASARIEEAHEMQSKNLSIGIPTGLKQLNKTLGGGWRKGSMYIIAARPGQGKTTLAIQCMFKAAELNYRCVYFTVEMPRSQLLQKYPSAKLGIDSSLIHSGVINKDECDKITDALKAASAMPFWICDDFAASFERMKIALSRQVRTKGVDLVVVDYIGQLRIDSEPRLAKHEVIGKISGWLKAFALEHNCVVLTVAQINRQAESSEDGPELWHLKDSGSLEQDCDMAVLIHRTEEKEIVDGSNSKLIPERCRLKIRKNRWGVESDIEVNSEFRYARFTDKEFSR